MITLTIPRATPSGNATHHKHWRASYDQKQLWTHEIWVALVQAMAGRGLPLEPPQKAQVTITRYGRILDIDNAYAGLKSILDSLKAHRLIADDDAGHLQLKFRQEKGTPRTVITIEDALCEARGV